jgi:uncharacterized protein
MNNKPILFYHKNCPDGFGSAYSFWKKYGDSIEYFPIDYTDAFPDNDNIDGRDVWMADFCFKRNAATELIERANSVLIIDHHLTAIKDMAEVESPKLTKVFDINKSGASLSWSYLFGDNNIPNIIRYIEDRDIAKWKLDGAREFLAYLDSIQMAFEEWDEFNKNTETLDGMDLAIRRGHILLNYINQLSKSAASSIHTINLVGMKVPAINTSIFIRGDIITKMAMESDVGFAAAYHFNGSKFVFSLRSAGKVDVESIAKGFVGGGGHKFAAGFNLSAKDAAPILFE